MIQQQGSDDRRTVVQYGVLQQSDPALKDDDDDSSESASPLDASLFQAVNRTLTSQDGEEEPKLVDGNVYRFLAFRRFGSRQFRWANGASVFTPPDDCPTYAGFMFGISLLMLIQVLGPFALLASNWRDVVSRWKPLACFDYDFSQWGVVLLAWACLFCFILLAFFSCDEEAENCRKACRLARVLKHFGQPVQSCFILVDACINCFASVALSISMFAILFAESNAQDVIFDSLSVGFLLKICSLASDFSFLGTVWDPVKVGKFYHHLEDSGAFQEAGIPAEDEDDLRVTVRNPASAMRKAMDGGDIPHSADEAARKTAAAMDDAMIRATGCINALTKWVLALLLLFALPAPFLFESEAEKDHSLNFGHNTSVPAEDARLLFKV